MEEDGYEKFWEQKEDEKEKRNLGGMGETRKERYLKDVMEGRK